MSNWRNRIVGEGSMPASQFQANPYNWREHPQEQRAALHGALNEVGWVQRVIVNRRTGNLVDGHERVWQALQNGDAEVPYVEVDLSEEEEAYVLATLDPIGAMAQMAKEKVAELLESVKTEEEGVQGLLNEISRRAGVVPDVMEDNPPDPAEELASKWGTARGQKWSVGSHWLVCGDATDKSDVEMLLGDEVPYLMVTDPPYGLNYDPSWKVAAAQKGYLWYGPSRTGVVPNDDRTDWSDAYRLFPGAVLYAWAPSGGLIMPAGKAVEDAGFEIRNQIIWRKPRVSTARGDYKIMHETCWYAVRKGMPGRFIGPDNETTVWDIGRDRNAEGGHATQKPIECMARPIRNHEGNVYDPFIGSGTTMVAAEQLHRVCYGMDISPAYVAVTLERMANLGLEPRLV